MKPTTPKDFLNSLRFNNPNFIFIVQNARVSIKIKAIHHSETFRVIVNDKEAEGEDQKVYYYDTLWEAYSKMRQLEEKIFS